MGNNPIVQFILQPILIFGVVFHFVMGMVLDYQNRKSRSVKYYYVKGSSNSSWMSRNMILSGIVVLLFMFLHFYDFWIPEMNYKYVEVNPLDPDRYYFEMTHKFESPIRVSIYSYSFLFLGLHLLHGFNSSFQSVGVNNKYILSIDQGTTSTRSIVFNNKFEIVSFDQIELKQYFPKDGCVEHDPKEIFETVLKTSKNAIKKSNIRPTDISAIGITNQRETTVLWDKETGEPVYKAIVWQDRRTVNYCKELQKKGYTKKIQKITGLVIDSYFSATKIKWIIDNIESSKKLLKENRLLFGTIDTWILWKLTEGRSHYTEATNASRTMLYDISKNSWSKSLLKIFNIPASILPMVKDSVDEFGYTTIFGSKIKIGGIAGDQKAATIGQACFEPGSIKSTYGTGCFMIMNIGKNIKISKNNLLTTIAYRIKGKTTYALEGSIFIAGAGFKIVIALPFFANFKACKVTSVLISN